MSKIKYPEISIYFSEFGKSLIETIKNIETILMNDIIENHNLANPRVFGIEFLNEIEINQKINIEDNIQIGVMLADEIIEDKLHSLSVFDISDIFFKDKDELNLYVNYLKKSKYENIEIIDKKNNNLSVNPKSKFK